MVCFYSVYEFAIVNLYMLPFFILWRFPFVSFFIYKTIPFYLSYHKKHGSHRLYPRHPSNFLHTKSYLIYEMQKKSIFICISVHKLNFFHEFMLTLSMLISIAIFMLLVRMLICSPLNMLPIYQADA